MQIDWYRATLGDVPDIVALSKQYFEAEVDDVFCTDARVLEQNLAQAVLQQHYNPWSSCVMLARDPQHCIQAYTWLARGEHAVWSADEMAVVRMVHVRMDASTRQRVQIIKQMIDFWEVWARECSVPVICSTTMRHDQTAFLRLHQQHGYSVRGSIAYKRLGAHNV